MNKINLIKKEVNILLFMAAMVIALVNGRIFRVRLEAMNLGLNPVTHGVKNLPKILVDFFLAIEMPADNTPSVKNSKVRPPDIAQKILRQHT